MARILYASSALVGGGAPLTGVTHLLRFDADTGAFLDDIYSTPGDVDGLSGAQLCEGPDGRIYFVDGFYNAGATDPYLFIFEADGSPVDNFAIGGGYPDTPGVVTVSPENRLFIVATAGGYGASVTTAREFDTAGTLLDTWTLPTPNTGLIQCAYVSGDTLYYIVLNDSFDPLSGNDQIQRYDLNTDAPLSNFVDMAFGGNPQYSQGIYLRRDAFDTGFVVPVLDGGGAGPRLLYIADDATVTGFHVAVGNKPEVASERACALFGDDTSIGVYGSTVVSTDAVWPAINLTDQGMSFTYAFGLLVTGEPSLCLTITKIEDPNTGRVFTVGVDPALDPATIDLASGNTHTFMGIAPDTYAVEETAVGGYTTTYEVSSGDPASAVVIAAAPNVTVTITNVLNVTPPPEPGTARAIRRVRRFAHLSDVQEWLFWKSLQLDMQTGVGTRVGQGTDPLVWLRYSDDGGHTWSTPRAMPAGQRGAYATRVIFRALGRSRDRVYEVSVSDPVPWVFLRAIGDVEKGIS